MSYSRILGAIIVLAVTAAADWTSVGPEGGPVLYGAISSGPGPVIYVCPPTTPASLARSLDGGATWQIMPGMIDRCPLALVISPNDPNTLYALRDGSHVYRTTDGGESWHLFGTVPDGSTVAALAVNPQNPDEIFGVGTNYVSGQQKMSITVTHDGGANWDTVRVDMSPDGTATSGNAIGIDPTDPDIIYVGGYSYSGVTSVIFKSVDGGRSWARLSGNSAQGLVRSIYVSPVNHNLVTVGCNCALIGSADGGVTWADRSGSTSNWMIAEVPGAPNILYTGTQGGISRSNDCGLTWQAVNPPPAGQYYRVLLTQSGTNGTLYAGNSEGMFKTSNYGASWQRINTGLTIGTVTALTAKPNDPQTLYAILKDALLFRTADGGSTWYEFPAINGCAVYRCVALDPTDPQIVYLLQGGG